MTKKRNPKVVSLKCDFEAHENYVVAVFSFGEMTLGMRFITPEQLFEFCNSLFQKAALVWPDNEWIKEYLSDDDRDGDYETDRLSRIQ